MAIVTVAAVAVVGLFGFSCWKMCALCKKQVPLFVYQQHVIHLAFLEKSPMGTNDSAKYYSDFVSVYSWEATLRLLSLLHFSAERERDRDGQFPRSVALVHFGKFTIVKVSILCCDAVLS